MSDKKHAIDLKELYQALKTKDKSWLANQPQEVQDKFSPWLYTRFMSGAGKTAEEQAYYIMATNEYANLYSKDLQKDKKLLYLLLTTVVMKELPLSNDFMYKFPKALKGNKTDKSTNSMVNFFLKEHPEMKMQDAVDLANLYTIEEFKELLEEYGYSDDKIKKFFANSK